MKTGYTAATLTAGVALTASTAATILSVISPAQFGTDLLAIRLGIDSVTAANQPVAVELVAFTADGTGTALTVQPVYGRGTTTASIPVGFTGKHTYTVEPTGGTVIDSWSLTPVGGTVLLPLDPRSPDVGASIILGLRLKPGSSITAGNAHATMWFERC